MTLKIQSTVEPKEKVKPFKKWLQYIALEKAKTQRKNYSLLVPR